MKKTTKIVTGLLAAILLSFAYVITAMASGGAVLAEAMMGATEQGPDWHYMARVDGGEWQELHHTPDWGDNWQYSPTPQEDDIYFSMYYSSSAVRAFVGFDDGKRYDIAACFTVSEAGTLTIAPWRHIFFENYGDISLADDIWTVANLTPDGTIDAVIMHNENELYRGTSSPDEIISSPALTIDAAPGDEIWFIAIPNDRSGDVFMNDIAIAPGDAAPGQPAMELVLPLEIDHVAPTTESALVAAMAGQTEQGPTWNYLARMAGNDWHELYYTEMWGDNWQISSDPHGDQIYISMYHENGFIWSYVQGDGTNSYELAVRYNVPESGTVTISPWRHVLVGGGSSIVFDGERWVVNDFSSSDPVEVAILYNGIELYRAFTEAREIIASPAITIVDVEAGDEILFAMMPMPGSSGLIFMNDVDVTYGDTAPPQAEMLTRGDLGPPTYYGGSSVFSLRDTFVEASQQGPTWYYMMRYGDGEWQNLHYYPEWGSNWQVTDDPNHYQIWYSLFDWNGVSASAGYDGEGNPYEIAAVFRPLQSGSLRIAPWQHILYSGNDDGVNYHAFDGNPSAAEIRLNDTTVYFQRLSGGYQISGEFSIDVQVGDMVYFIMRPMELVDADEGWGNLRMDDILVSFDPSVDFDEHIARMPVVSAENRGIPDSQPGDPIPGEGGSAEEPVVEDDPAPADEAPAATATPEPTAAPTPTPIIDGESDGSNTWVIIVVIVLALAAVAVVIVVMKKKKPE